MIAGSEVTRLLKEFEQIVDTQEMPKHLEQTKLCQNKFISDVKNLIEGYTDLGNPFLDESNQLLSLKSQIIATE